ncbi:MAG: hypothetical protein ABL932_23040, partial [Terricaulis sp.]
ASRSNVANTGVAAWDAAIVCAVMPHARAAWSGTAALADVAIIAKSAVSMVLSIGTLVGYTYAQACLEVTGLLSGVTSASGMLQRAVT